MDNVDMEKSLEAVFKHADEEQILNDVFKIFTDRNMSSYQVSAVANYVFLHALAQIPQALQSTCLDAFHKTGLDYLKEQNKLDEEIKEEV